LKEFKTGLCEEIRHFRQEKITHAMAFFYFMHRAGFRIFYEKRIGDIHAVFINKHFRLGDADHLNAFCLVPF